jgi:hypothetical protein
METWIQFGITLITMMGLFIWVRTESRADVRHMDNKIDSIRELVNAIHLEVKDFHNRMADLERKK